ncbi:hypothetical protein BHE74_00044160 [Ensete ventricosum]|nr:hypothetical protein GW17_00004239 [Ensete ventricosum]RWW49640.1 hypothetical protein BHE74_00044160 [Ensete ventricosum]RZR89635.1 hypothetical protein BHM03_00017404 [Ensete ventricosum]
MVERSSFMHQIEPGSQTEQAPPSAFLQLTPEELHGFRFLTISVAPHPVIPSFLCRYYFPFRFVVPKANALCRGGLKLMLMWTVSGRPPPAASMAVGQFFNPEEGEREFSAAMLLRSSYVQEVHA